MGLVGEIEAPERLVLECGGCGERLVLLGPEGDWYRGGRQPFTCAGCGRSGLTLANRVVVGKAPRLPGWLRPAPRSATDGR
jgi:hypothetical protein